MANADPERLNVHGTEGEAIELPIAHGPATGYSWQLDLPEGVERVEDGPRRSTDPPNRPGAAAGGAVRVKAGKGTHHIHARLVRSWQPEKPSRVVDIALTVE